MAVHPHFVVQMRSGRETGRSDVGDLLATLHTLPAHHDDLGAVRVPRHQAVAVIDREHVAVAFDPRHLRHDAGRRRVDLHAHRCGEVDALVRTREVEDRMHALARERTRQPSFGRHDRRHRGVARALARRGVVRLVQRMHENVGAPGQLIHVDARSQRLLPVATSSRQAVALEPLPGRPADARLLYVLVDR